MRKKLIKSELAKLFNTSKAAIRYYEDKGLICAKQDENGYRLYDWDDVERLGQIIFMKDLGSSIEEIKKYIENENDIKKLLEEKREYIDESIRRLVSTRNRIDNILSLSDEEKILLDEVKREEIEERKFFTLMESRYYDIKDFYNSISDLKKKIIPEKEFILLHQNYSKDNNSFKNSKMLLPYVDNLKGKDICEVILKKANYLVINYVYREIQDFILAYDKVINYAEMNGWRIDESCFFRVRA
ncbi:MAG: MerR family transcriptional regulator [Sarcina sp.]